MRLNIYPLNNLQKTALKTSKQGNSNWEKNVRLRMESGILKALRLIITIS